MKQKERPAKENAGKGGGNGMLIETSEGNAGKGDAGEGGGKGMLNEAEVKACRGECWQGRREWNAE